MSVPLPRALTAGDRVAVLAPSSPVDESALLAGVERLRTWGFSPEVVGSAAPAESPRYLAGADDVRARAWRAAIDPDAGFRAILCARGGYGAMRLLEHLDTADLEGARELWVIGSSDVTAIHAALLARGARGCVYGPMPSTPAFLDEANGERLRALLSGSPPPTLHGKGLVPGRACAPLSGGCLSLVAALAGTPYAIDARGTILLLEDVGERAYRLDRLLTQLRLAGTFEGVVGVAVGSLERCNWDAIAADALLADRLGDLGVPVVTALDFGHGAHQASLPLRSLDFELDGEEGVLRPAAGTPAPA